MREITVHFPLRDEVFEEDLARAAVLAEDVGSAFHLDVGDTGAGFGQRDVSYAVPQDVDAWALAAEVEDYLHDQGVRDVAVEAYVEEEMTLRAKGTMDGSVTLAQAAEKLRAFAGALEVLAAQGWELSAPVEDDYGFALKQEGGSRGGHPL